MRYEEWVEKRTQSCGACFKKSESYLGAHYEFDGVEFDHETHKVRPSERVRGKIKAQDLDDMTCAQLESLIGRLVHCSAIVGDFVPKRYWVLKFAQRRINALNRGLSRPDDTVSLPPAVAKQLSEWVRDVSSDDTWTSTATHITRRKVGAYLFTDAFFFFFFFFFLRAALLF